MPQMMAFIPLIAAVAGPLLSKALGGSSSDSSSKNNSSSNTGQQAAALPAVTNLFSSPDQIKQATDRYTQTGTAKWNQILSNMGAAGGTGGPDVSTQIGNQANQLAVALASLNSDSGYGNNPMNNLDAVLRGAESGIAPKYAVY